MWKIFFCLNRARWRVELLIREKKKKKEGKISKKRKCKGVMLLLFCYCPVVVIGHNTPAEDWEFNGWQLFDKYSWDQSSFGYCLPSHNTRIRHVDVHHLDVSPISPQSLQSITILVISWTQNLIKNGIHGENGRGSSPAAVR